MIRPPTPQKTLPAEETMEPFCILPIFLCVLWRLITLHHSYFTERHSYLLMSVTVSNDQLEIDHVSMEGVVIFISSKDTLSSVVST